MLPMILILPCTQPSNYSDSDSISKSELMHQRIEAYCIPILFIKPDIEFLSFLSFPIIFLVITATLPLFAIGEECILEGPSFETASQALLFIVDHIVIHTYCVVAIDVAFFNYFINTTKDLKNTTRIPRQ